MFSGMSSQSTTPRTKRKNAGSNFSVFSWIITRRAYSDTPEFVCPPNPAARSGFSSGKYSKLRIVMGASALNDMRNGGMSLAPLTKR